MHKFGMTGVVPGPLTFRIGALCNRICNIWGAPEIDPQHRILFTFFQDLRYVEMVLTELVISRTNMLVTEGDCCESIQSIKDKPCGLEIFKAVKASAVKMTR